MPFLLPALASLLSDSMVLYLHHLGLYAANAAQAAAAAAATTIQQEDVQDSSNNSVFSAKVNDGDDDGDDYSSPLAAFYYRVGYLPVLAGLRIALLMWPLFFHSYTGTALKCATFYRVLYSTSLLLLLLQMLTLAIMDPKSLQALVIVGGGGGQQHDQQQDQGSVITSMGGNPHLLQHLHELRRVWCILLLSTNSNIWHFFMFWHVRSTAQSTHYASSFYFAIRSSASSPTTAHRATASASTGLYGNHVAAVNEFVVDLRLRLNRAKKEWTKRLDDFVNHGSGGINNNSGNISNNNNPLKNHPLTPFRVLLSLFAYEDVLENGKLEAVYKMDGGQGITFYIPQLLSFLLHGAGDSLQSSSALEEWILQKCRTNVFFAHKCYWFLRAWCLEQVIVMPPPTLNAASIGGGSTTATQYTSSLSSLCHTPNRNNHNHKTATSSRSNVDSILQVPPNSRNNNSKDVQRSSLSPSPPPLPPPYLDQPVPSPTSTDTWDDDFDGGDGEIAGTSSTSTALVTTKGTTQRRMRCPSPLPPISSRTMVTNGNYSNNATSGASILSAAVLATPSSTLRTTASSILSTSLQDCLAPPKAGGGLRRPIMISTSNSNLGGMMVDKFLPEERAMIERLMLRVKECGQESALLLQYGAKDSSPHNATAQSYSCTVNINTSKYHVKSSENSTSHCSNTGGDEDSFVTATQPDYDTTDDEYEDLIPPPFHESKATACKSSSASTSPVTSLLGQVETMAIAAGQIPIHPLTQQPSSRHLACLAAGQQKYGFLPWAQVLEGRRQQHTKPIGRETTYDFDQTPRFVDSLLHMAEALFRVPREQRKAELLCQLRILECELLPSNAIYLPISQKVHHTVWRIVPEESIPLNTKERVPCLLALEVVNHDAAMENSSRATRRGDDNAWRSILDHIGHHRSIHDVRHPASPLSSHGAAAARSSPSTEQAAFSSLSPPQKSFQHVGSASVDVSMGALGVGDAVGGNNKSKSSSEVAGMSEADIVNQWRFKVRQPLRHVSLIDKVTGGLDKVLRTTSGGVATVAAAAVRGTGTMQRSTSDELQNLVSALNGERFVRLRDEEKPEAAAAARLTTISLSSDSAMLDPELGEQIIDDAEEGILQMGEQQHAGVLSSNISRASSFTSIVSMGQWGTPQPTPDNHQLQRQHPPINRLMIPPQSTSPFNTDRRSSGNIGQQIVRRRLDREADEHRNGCSSSLPYGSDHDDDHEEDDLFQKDWYSDSGGRSRNRSIDVIDDIHGDPLSPLAAKRKHTKPPPVVFRESWVSKEERVRQKSVYGEHPGWKLLPILVKAQDDLRQEQLASQLIYRMASILANENVPVWLCPYEIIALTDTGGIIEAIPDTISLDSLKKNDPNFTSLRDFFHSHYGDGTEELADAKANFVESLAAYSIVCFLLQIKDRHNGNILLDSRGHLIHIDFGFFFLSSPGKNVGFESAPFKLTRDFVDILGGPNGHLFHVFRELCVKTFLALRKHCMEIILLVEMLKQGNERLQCFRGRPDDAIQQLRERFRLDLNDRACREYVNALVDDSIENWRTKWYDRYQRYFVGVL